MGINVQEGKQGKKAGVKHSFSPLMEIETAEACESEGGLVFFGFWQMNRCIHACFPD